jgi:RNA polymerase sigma-70 factor (ECF subfamily)
MNSHEQPSRRHELPSLSSTLLNRVRQMQPDAWSRLVEVFGPIVYRWCRQSGLSGHDASDVVQEVFASVSRGIGNFHRSQADQSFRNWLATITRNRVRDFHRRSAKQPHAAGGTEAHVEFQNLADPIQSNDLDATISSADLEGEISRRVLDLVRSEFEERSWLAFHKTAVMGKLPIDVAKELGISVAAVYQAKSRVLRRLRQLLADLPK